MWGWIVSAVVSRVGLTLLVGALALAGGLYVTWKHGVVTNAKNEVRQELQQRDIKKLKNVSKAQNHFRRSLRNQPNSLRDDDGYRRD